jgi:glycosyltransferase involved in cell wall biosynthesis
MKVALLTDADVFAGTERHLLDLARALLEAESECHPLLACPHPSPLQERARECGVATIAVPANRGRLFDRRLLRILRRELQSGRIDILHAHNGRTLLHSVLAKVLSRRGRVVYTQHFLEPAHATSGGLKARLFRAVHHWVNRRVAAFIAVSAAARDAMVARGDADADKIRVVHHALFDPAQSTLAPASEVRRSLQVPEEARLVVAVARLEKEKSLDTLVDAISFLRRQNLGVYCIIAGEGAERKALQQKIDSLQLSPFVQLTGFYADTLSLVGSCDLFVLPSAVESFGLVLLEAMALGKPVVATHAGGPAEVVDVNVTGCLVPPRDAEALALAMQKVLCDEKLRDELGRNGRLRYEQLFQIPRMAQETLAVYRAALQYRSGRQ